MVRKLSEIEKGKRFRLHGIDAGHQVEKRLKDMGLTPDGLFTMVKNDHAGPLIIDVRGSNIILGRGLSAKMLMEEMDGPAAAH